MWIHYLKVAFRSILKYKSHSIISILGVGIGMLVLAVCIGIVREDMSRNTSFPHYKRISTVVSKDNKGNYRPYNFQDLKKIEGSGVPFIEKMGYYRGTDRNYFLFENDRNKAGIPRFISAIAIDSVVADIIGLRLTNGNLEEAFRHEKSVFISASKAKEIYGELNPVGMTFREWTDNTMSENDFYIVQGVYEEIPSRNFLSWSPSSIIFCITQPELETRHLTACVLLSESYYNDLDKIRKLTEEFMLDRYEDGEQLYCLFQKTYIEFYEKSLTTQVMYGVLFIIGFLIFLAGWINFLNFSVGSFFNRTKDLHVRKMMGAQHKNIFGQLFMEICILLAFAVVVSCTLGELFIPWWNQQSTARDLAVLNIRTINIQQLEYFSYIIVVSAVVCGFISFRLKNISLYRSLYFNNKHRLRNLLIGVQLFICFLFLSASLSVLVQINRLNNSFLTTLSEQEKEDILFLPLMNKLLEGHKDVIISQIKNSANVADVICLDENLSSLGVFHIDINGVEYSLNRIRSNGDFAGFFKVPLLQGRSPSESKEVVVVPLIYQNMMGEGNILAFPSWNHTLQVTGIMQEIILGNQKELYVEFDPSAKDIAYVKSMPGKSKEVLNEIYRIVQKYTTEPAEEQGIVTLNALFKDSTKDASFLGKLLLLFSIICLTITFLGVYSAITLDTNRRETEVAVRRINGASGSDIFYLFGQLYFKLLCFSGIPALLIVFFLTGKMMEFFEQTRVYFNYQNPSYWLLIFIFISVLILAIIFCRILRITKLNPSEVLKKE